MARTSTYQSPDGELRFEVVRGDDRDVYLGFAGFPWHTHGDLLVGTYGASQEAAIARFIEDLLESRSIISVHSQRGTIVDVRITFDPGASLHYSLAGESIEFRYWDGSQYRTT